MHPLHDYVAKQLAQKLKDRHVVVWYDERDEFRSFVDEVRGGPRATSQTVLIAVDGTKANLAQYAGSLFELRSVVEAHVSGDEPDAMVIYIPGVAHDTKASVLMELEKAGMSWKPALKQLAKNVLLQKYTLGVVDEMLPEERKVSYEDIARALSARTGSVPPSILKAIFDGSDGDELLAAWLVDEQHDSDIVSKDAVRELLKLVRSRLGLEVGEKETLTKVRAITRRYVLAGEFRLDLSCEEPSSLVNLVRPKGKDAEHAVRQVALKMRTAHPDRYAEIADAVELELGLHHANLAPKFLGTIDTFRFEEKALLRHAGELVANGAFDDALILFEQREKSFWLERDTSRKLQWACCERMATLGKLAADTKKTVRDFRGDAEAWFAAYTNTAGWWRLDQAQRTLETLVSGLDEDPDERPLALVRQAYEDACQAMALGFARALEASEWQLGKTLHQTKVFSDFVQPQPRPTAYFLVDAMRYEMGVALTGRLPRTSEVSIKAAAVALPSITPVGMAALLPGAAQSFAVVERDQRLGAQIGDEFLPDLTGRKKFAAKQVPKLVDIALDDLLGLSQARLRTKIRDAQIIIVRSQEIDAAGEGGFGYQARKVMDNVIENLARAIRRLAAEGVEFSVVSADHGHIFGLERDDSMKIDAPGGDTVDLHRRCWIGRGGKTPSGCVRVSAAKLGYASDLEFVFPAGAGVFKSGGDLAFYHGGPSLQEMAVPVLVVRSPKRASQPIAKATTLSVDGVPEKISNLIFTVSITLGERQMSLGSKTLRVRPLLVGEGRQVGAPGVVVGADFHPESGVVTLTPHTRVTVGFKVTDENVSALRVLIQDPDTDAELYRSPNDIPLQILR